MKKIILLLALVYNFAFALTSVTYIDKDIFQNPANGYCYKMGSFVGDVYGYSPYITGTLSNYTGSSIVFIVPPKFSGNSAPFIVLKGPYVPYYGNDESYYLATQVDCSEAYAPPPPTCDPETQEEINGECVCKAGYNDNQTAGTCVPDITCPEPMIYEVTEAWHGFWASDKKCIPNASISESECLSISGAKWGSEYNVFGTGCYIDNYSKSLFVNNGLETAINFGPFSPFWNASEDLVVQAINTLFASGKNSWNAIKSKFDDVLSSNPDASLQTYKPEFTDLVVGDDGIYYIADLTSSTPVKNADDWLTTYNKFRENGWDLPETPTSYDPTIHDPLPPVVNNPSFPSVTNADNLYLGGDALEIKANSIITKNILDDFVVFEEPHGALFETETQFATLKSSLSGTQTKTFDINAFKVAETSLSDRVVSEYTSMIKNGDGSLTTVNTKKITLASDGSKIYEVEVVTPIETPSGTKTLSKSYTVTKDSAGNVTNNIYKTASTVTSSTTNGGTTTTTNSTSTSSTTVSSTKPAVDLSATNVKLDDLISKIDEINNYKPEGYEGYDTAIVRFADVLNDWSVGVDSALDFVNGIKSNITDLISDFENAKSVFENKPTLNVATGSCPFEAPWIQGTTKTINPCEFISPYKPILAIFFTMLFTMMVLSFSLKYLFNVSLGGSKS